MKNKKSWKNPPTIPKERFLNRRIKIKHSNRSEEGKRCTERNIIIIIIIIVAFAIFAEIIN